LVLIPQKVGSKLTVESVFKDKTSILAQETILDDLESSINFVMNNNLNTDNKEIDNKKLFDLEISLVKDEKIINYVKEKFNRGINHTHSCSHLKVKRVFDIKINHMLEEYEKVKDSIGYERKLWHGSRTGNILSILKNGMIVPKKTESHVTARMFGDGIYFSDQSTKALNYSYGYWSGGGRDRNCYAFICNVLLGKQYIPNSYREKLPKAGYNSTFAKANHSGVLNNEMIVYNTNQISPRYLVEFY